MKLQMVGCSHHHSPIEFRERLAFPPEEIPAALNRLQRQFPESEAVLISTCNRVELYSASHIDTACPTHHDLVTYLAEIHDLKTVDIFDALFERTGEDVVRHLFMVASSLDSMVVGEAQVLAQVKQAYDLARQVDTAGPLTNAMFQAAIHVAKRVANETAINQRRVSIPSVAVADFAAQIFERFDDKQVLVIGAGEMGEETLKYLRAEGARRITVCNRNTQRAMDLAKRVGGHARPWEELEPELVAADLVIGTTGSNEPVLTADQYRSIHQQRQQRPIFILDLAVPRDFDPTIGDFLGVYLYSIDDLKHACEANRRLREKEWPKAERIIEAETQRFMADLNHRATAPAIKRLRDQADRLRQEELQRLWNKLGDVDQRTQQEISRSFDRLVNKLLHPPLESLRDEARQGSSHGLRDALIRLFQLKD